MPFFLDADQTTIATESYRFWEPKCGHTRACGLLGNEGGETGFKWSLVNGVQRTAAGDHGEAFGIFQWHAPRAAAILKHTGFDVINGTHLDMLNGAYAEMTGSWSPYRHVWPALMGMTTIWSVVSELVAKYEQSASQASDDMKRAAIAVYCDHLFTT